MTLISGGNSEFGDFGNSITSFYLKLKVVANN